MSKKIKIDDLFKDNLDQYVSPVSANMWASIDSELNKKANPKKTGLILFWSVLLLFIIGLLGFSILRNSEQPTERTPLASESAVDAVNGIDATINSTKSQINSASESQAVGNKNAITEENKSKTQPLAEVDASLLPRKELQTNKVVKQPIATKQVSATNQSQRFLSATQRIKTTVTQTKNTTSSKDKLNLTPVIEERQESPSTNGDQQSEANTFNNVVFDSSLKENMHRFPVVPLFATSLKEVTPLTTYDITDKSCPSTFKMTHRPKFHFDAVLGLDYANRRFTATSDNGASLNYIDIREDTEKYASAYSIGARMSVSYHTGFVWRIGLMYHQVNEKINLIGKAAYAHIPDVLILEQDNTYQFVDVPILIGYEMTQGKLTYGFNAGVYVNLSFASPTNYILSADKEKILLSDPVTISESPVFKGQLGMSAYGSLAATYQLTDHLSVICEPNVLVRPQSVTLADYALEQRYVHFGLMTGLRYKF